jgi:hypothetical protein
MSELRRQKIFSKNIRRAGMLAAAGITTLCFLSLACSKASTPERPSQTEKPPAPPSSRAEATLQPLFSHIWHVTKAPATPSSGSIYVFLPNGTLLETSCTETYRIATWTVDKATPQELHVVEDKQLAFTATIAELSDSTLRLEMNLVRSKETQDVTYAAVDGEFVCPDLRK